MVSHDHRARHGRRFGGHTPERFGSHRWRQHDIACQIGRGHIGNVFRHDDTPVEPVRHHSVLQPRNISIAPLRVARQHEHQLVALIRCQHGQRLDGNELPFPFGQASRQ